MKLHKYYQRASLPHGFWGRRVLKLMNDERLHGAMPQWALDGLDIGPKASILDIGCGGGANIKRLLSLYPECSVVGIDHSPLALDYAYNLNYDEIMRRCIVVESDIETMQISKESFDLVTAFECAYYCNMQSCMAQIMRVLKPGGMLLIANEMDGESPMCRSLEAKMDHRIHAFTIGELKQILADAGYTSIHSKRHQPQGFIAVTGVKPHTYTLHAP